MILQSIHLHQTASTNTYAKQNLGNGVGHGTVIWADNQSAGRGRLGKTWQSNLGKGLYCSIVYTPTCSREELSKITLVAGLAVAKVIEQFVVIPVMLKWPNDIYVDGKKCGGILCEAIMGKEQDSVVIGIGINVVHNEQDFEKEIAHRATSLALLGTEVSVESLLHDVYEKVMEHVKDFEQGQWPSLLEQWQKKDYLVGKASTWLLGNGEVKIGRAEGVDEDGQLYIVTSDGVRHQVVSGDVQARENVLADL